MDIAVLPLVSALYAGLAGILLTVLAARVVLRRRSSGIGIGVRDDRDLERRVRVHANAVEYVPIAIVLLVAAELVGLAAIWLHVAGATLIVGRVLHAIGFSGTAGPSAGRFLGIISSWLVTLLLGGWLVGRALGLY